MGSRKRRTPHPAPIVHSDPGSHRLVLAALWPRYHQNVGTLVRTCDAVRACLATTTGPAADAALARGDTLGPGAVHVHAVPTGQQGRWLRTMAADGYRIVAVEAPGTVQVADLQPLQPGQAAVVLVGNERAGMGAEVWGLLDDVVELPMLGRGTCLNVAVAGSLVLYRLAGLA